MSVPEREPRHSTFTLSAFKEAQTIVPRLKLTPEEERFGLAVHELFLKTYQQAEKTRRWTLAQIDWSLVASQPLSRDLANMIDTFKRVEDFIPDFAEAGLGAYRRNLGLSNSHINWSAEEQRHGFALGLILEKSGALTHEAVVQNRMEIFGKKWTAPYETPRQNIIYTANQELATYDFYRKLSKQAKDEGCHEASRAITLIAKDETAHHAFYRDIVKMFGDRDPQGTARDILLIRDTFVMPAQYLMTNSSTDYGKRMVTMRRNGIFSEEDQQVILDKTMEAFGFKSREKVENQAV